jgi:hypothetical protein
MRGEALVGQVELWLLNHIPGLVLALLVVGGTVALAMLGAIVVRRRFPRLVDGDYNPMVTGVLQVYSGLYGILLALIIVSLWTEHADASSSVATEAVDLAQIIRNSEAFPPDAQARIKDAIRSYVHSAVEVQWPIMTKGHWPNRTSGDSTLQVLFHAVQSFEPTTQSQQAFYAANVTSLNDLIQQRRIRRSHVVLELPVVLKILIYVGAAVMVVTTFIFGAKNPKIPLLFLVSSIALLVGFSMFLIVVLEYPFAGALEVGPSIFKEGALAQFW